MRMRNITVAAAVASAMALGMSRMALAQDAAPATQAPAADDVAEISQVVVTGTRIRGVAPVGSSLISVDQALVKESGLTTTNDVLNSIPSVLNIGVGNHSTGGLAINNGFSTSNSPNIHGLGVQATLSLVNGHRMFVSGTLSDVFDPNNYPVAMIQPRRSRSGRHVADLWRGRDLRHRELRSSSPRRRDRDQLRREHVEGPELLARHGDHRTHVGTGERPQRRHHPRCAVQSSGAAGRLDVWQPVQQRLLALWRRPQRRRSRRLAIF